MGLQDFLHHACSVRPCAAGQLLALEPACGACVRMMGAWLCVACERGIHDLPEHWWAV